MFQTMNYERSLHISDLRYFGLGLDVSTCEIYNKITREGVTRKVET
jgi:hypothetical protein